ncbi:hypothetical protein HDU96_005022 [Phlyctochytrium bullatum]|nr:hypothetical protein HDU96_005022 [Phlyctochytrium bullatum]
MVNDGSDGFPDDFDSFSDDSDGFSQSSLEDSEDDDQFENDLEEALQLLLAIQTMYDAEEERIRARYFKFAKFIVAQSRTKSDIPAGANASLLHQQVQTLCNKGTLFEFYTSDTPPDKRGLVPKRKD